MCSARYISRRVAAERVDSGGGADGSIVIFADTETGFPANIGLDEVIAIQKPFLERSNMTVADLYVSDFSFCVD